MPIYEYECAACGRRHEILQKIGEPPLRKCSDCGRPELSKLVSAAGFRLAGGGWYETDFKTGDKRNLAAGADASSDNKPEAKSEDSKGKVDKGETSAGKKSGAAASKPASKPASGAGSS